ncbi:MAG: phage portal protein [Burkholderiaceae bacterium]|nr:phage portal protein [Burkholderiaceae bacterium]
MNLLDRLIAAWAPRLALDRARARAALAGLRRHYDAARTDRRERLRASLLGPNAELAPALATLRARARHFVRNNPYAAAAVELLAAYQVGTGITPRSATGDAELDRAADQVWREWSRPAHADITGLLDFHGLTHQAARVRAEIGEAVLRIVRLTRAEQRARGLMLPVALQALEADQIDSGQDGTVNNARVVQGVEIDGWGRPVAYHLHAEHPGERAALSPRAGGAALKIPAAEILHVFAPLRPGQLRGVPDAAWVLTRLAQLDRYEDAALEQALVQACLAVFVTADVSAAHAPIGAPAPGADDMREETLSPGMITYLRPGEAVQTVAPAGSAGAFRDYTRHQLTAIATGWGLTYDLLTGDLSAANYSSLRAGRLAFRRRIERAQWLMLIPRLCQPVWEAVIAAAQMDGRLPMQPKSWPAEWTPPRFEMVDPLKDTQAEVMAIRAGLKTLGDSLGEQGYAVDAMIAETQAIAAKLDAAGLILDSDPRRITASGNPVNPAAISAVVLSAAEAAQTTASD